MPGPTPFRGLGVVPRARPAGCLERSHIAVSKGRCTVRYPRSLALAAAAAAGLLALSGCGSTRTVHAQQVLRLPRPPPGHRRPRRRASGWCRARAPASASSAGSAALPPGPVTPRGPSAGTPCGCPSTAPGWFFTAVPGSQVAVPAGLPSWSTGARPAARRSADRSTSREHHRGRAALAERARHVGPGQRGHRVREPRLDLSTFGAPTAAPRPGCRSPGRATTSSSPSGTGSARTRVRDYRLSRRVSG